MNQLASIFIDAYFNGLRLANMYTSIYSRALEKAVEEEREDVIGATVGGGKETISSNPLESIYNNWLKHTDEALKTELKTEHFIETLSRYTQALMELRSVFRKAGYPVDYFDRIFDWYVRSHMVFSLIPKESLMAPFDVVYRKGKARLLHYSGQNKETSSTGRKHPVMIIYAPINRFHILDLNPKRSVVRSLLASGNLDVYLLDWGYPDWGDNNLSVEDYLGYVNDSAEVVRDLTQVDKISILGYCWGGIFALLHAAINAEAVRNLVLIAVPVDFSKDHTILATWSKAINVDSMIDEFGHMDGQVLNLGFLLRDPPRYGFDKYLKFFQRFYDSEFIDTFIDVERWLYDTPLIPGALYRQIINDCYRNNLLISGKMKIISRGKEHKVDLQKISIPVLSVIAENDDLVSPASSAAINDHISSEDKSVLKNPGGHVALCVSSTAHKQLWPQVAKWLVTSDYR